MRLPEAARSPPRGSANSSSVWPRKHEPGDRRGDADQHGEGIVIEVTGLQANDVARHVKNARGHAIRSEAIDDEAVAAFPEQAPEPHRWPDKQEIVDFVEVPFVEKEPVEQVLVARQSGRDVGPAHVELVGHQKTANHHQGRQERKSERQTSALSNSFSADPRLKDWRKNSPAPCPVNRPSAG